MADETNLDAGVGRCAHRGDGQHTAHRIDVIGERLHNGGIIRAKQGDIVGGNRFGGLAGGGLHLDASQSGGRNRALSNGVGHIIGAGIGGLERQRHIRRIGGRRSAVGRIHLSQLCRLQGSAMHVRGQLDDGIRVGNGGFRYRVDDRGKVFAGLTEKYTMPVPVAVPSETVTSTPTRPDASAPVLNVSWPSARVDTCTWSVFWATAETRVSGSPSGSLKLLSALAV